MGVIQSCRPRADVLTGQLQDAIFAADFGHVVEGRAPAVYQDPAEFFRNTYPAKNLCDVVRRIFEPLSKPDADSGQALRLCTGFGGGKTHTLIALWHLGRNIADASLGTEILPAGGRPRAITVAGFDGDKAGTTVCFRHPELITHSLWGELAYQLGGPEGYSAMVDVDDPEKAPDAVQLRSIFPQDTPVLILLDELVKYLPKLSDRGRDVFLAFMSQLVSEVQQRPRTVLVIADPGAQGAFELPVDDKVKSAFSKLDDELDRKTSHFDPIGPESAGVITRRLFEAVDRLAAESAANTYRALYDRVRTEHPDVLPENAIAEAERIKTTYPFHPRLLQTARDRLGAIQDFQRSRGTLRLFARIIRDIWTRQQDLELINEGDVNWSDAQLQADLLDRLGREPFKAAVSSDVEGHAARLDEQFSTDVHRRVASALLLESLQLEPTAAMTASELTLATLRPSDAGPEPAEALDRLLAVCWHTYPDDAGKRFQFRYQPNVNAQIEERAEQVPLEDAIQECRMRVQQYFSGGAFKLWAFPAAPSAVRDTADLKLVLAESEDAAKRICEYEDDRDPASPTPRGFRNAIVAVAPKPDLLQDAAHIARRLRAAEAILKENPKNRMVREQLEGPDGILEKLRRRARIAAARSWCRVVLPGRQPQTLEEKYLVPENDPLSPISGQQRLMPFLLNNDLIYGPSDVLDVDLLLDELLKGGTPSVEHPGAVTARSVHERALRSPKLRLLPDESPVRRSILKAVEEGRLLVRLPDGSVYDREGCVRGPEGGRVRRRGERLPSLPLEKDVLLAPPDAECVAGWIATDEGRPGSFSLQEAARIKHTNPEQLSQAIGRGLLNAEERDGEPRVLNDESFAIWWPEEASNTACSWEQAISLAAQRPLRRLTLTADNPQSAQSLIAVAQPLSARQLQLNVTTGGELKDGGEVLFLAEGLRPGHTLRPLEKAAELHRALKDGGHFHAELTLDFGGDGRTGAAAQLERAAGTAPEDVQVEAEFGAPQG